MNLLTFDYKDLAGNETHRTVITISKPDSNYLTFDVSELPLVDQKNLLKELTELYDQYRADRDQVLDCYAVMKTRAFKPERMTNMVTHSE